MKRLYIIRGLPGSGKTTLAEALTRHNVAADDFMENEAGEYAFDPSRLPYAHSKCSTTVRNWMKEEVDTIAVHNTFSMCWEAETYLELAKKHGYKVFVIECQNEFENTHGVPASTIEAMRNRWEPL